ncbi:MAG: hypothetical protein Q9160_005973 [Pyrenula sp. 1 TL-2023]
MPFINQSILSAIIFSLTSIFMKLPHVHALPSFTDTPAPGTIVGRAVNPYTNMEMDIVQGPRVTDTIAYLERNGGIKWEDSDNGQTVSHTYEEWAAAEQAVLGYKAHTFAHAMAMPATNDITTRWAPITPVSRTNLFARDGLDGGTETKATDLGDNKGDRATWFFCFKTGAFGKGLSLAQIAGFACAAVMEGIKYGGIRTWKSQQLPTPGPTTAKPITWFLQAAGWAADVAAANFCTFSFGQLQSNICLAKDASKRDLDRALEMRADEHPTRGAVFRVYDSAPKTDKKKLGSLLFELKIDPNTCQDDRDAC